VDLALMLPIEERWGATQYADLAVEAEALGYDQVLTGESYGVEAFALLGLIAARTERITLGTGVIPIPLRSPVLTAMGFATLASAAPGRVVAGLGAGTPGVAHDWHHRDFVAPVQAMREFVEVFRAALTGDKVAFEGTTTRAVGFRLGMPGAHVPVLMGAVGPRMLRLAGEVADGVFLTLCPAEEVPARLAAVGPPLPATVLLFADSGRHGNEARDRMRSLLRRYAAVPTHEKALGALGAAGDIPDHVVDRFLAIGPDGMAHHLRALADAGAAAAAVIPLPPTRGDMDEVRDTVVLLKEVHGQ
jgi:alkanesulfonate monooxygenase SsuD/methylene tetrahydromethanopterin reductase-like flavin-dependent oxidoreductase (luciferase family)